MSNTHCTTCGAAFIASEFTTGYGTAPNGERHCYECCAMRERESMKREGTATLYLHSEARPTGFGPDARSTYVPLNVTDWPGKLRFPVRSYSKSTFRGFGWRPIPRVDVWFIGPDGATWHGINKGDNDILRCKRTKGK